MDTTPTRFYYHPQAFNLETGGIFPWFQIAYKCWGKLNEKRDNVIWVCHAFTANADAHEWWPGMIGPGLLMDTERYFVVCANIFGSCYGTSGPLDENPKTGKPWFRNFPMITVRDLVNAHEILRVHLGIESVYLTIGGSIGAFQSLEWAIMYPDKIRNLAVIAGNASASPWNIALNEAQRMAITADATFMKDKPDGGHQGLKTARAIALISYRTSDALNTIQKESDLNKISNFKAASYLQHQGEKFIKRFNSYSYMAMTNLFDSHNVGRGRDSIEKALTSITADTIVIAMDSDKLFPPEEQRFLADRIPGAHYAEIPTSFGHDGFLIEVEPITKRIRQFLDKTGMD
jgi:homoserine O-acetyltransferase/O-succinyltransferase